MSDKPQPDTTDEKQEQDLKEYQFDVSMPWGKDGTPLNWRFSILTIKQTIRMRPAIREFWGRPLPINGTLDGISDLNSYEYAQATGLAEMRAACVDKPEEWMWEVLSDYDRVWALWQAYQKARDAFRATLGIF